VVPGLSATCTPGKHALTFRESDHTYWLGDQHVPNVTTILEANGFCDFSMVPADVLANAQRRGQDVHAARHLLDAGRLDWSTVSEEIGAYLESYLAWRSMHPGQVTFSERPLYHPIHRYAGMPDLVLLLERALPGIGARVLIDTKGGARMAGHEIQTAAYEALYNQAAPAFQRATGRAGLYLSRDGKPARLVPHREASDFRAFLAAQQLYEWRKHHEK
jgi:hypothetical protein